MLLDGPLKLLKNVTESSCIDTWFPWNGHISPQPRGRIACAPAQCLQEPVRHQSGKSTLRREFSLTYEKASRTVDCGGMSCTGHLSDPFINHDRMVGWAHLKSANTYPLHALRLAMIPPFESSSLVMRWQSYLSLRTLFSGYLAYSMHFSRHGWRVAAGR